MEIWDATGPQIQLDYYSWCAERIKKNPDVQIEEQLRLDINTTILMNFLYINFRKGVLEVKH